MVQEVQEHSSPNGPDLAQGVALAEFLDGKLAGHVGNQEVLLVHSGTEIFVVAARCTHYHGPLAEGLIVGTASVAPGITPVSIFAPAKPFARRP